ncbi:MAG: LexA family protein, partial [Gaiellaceae bacterium]
ATATKACPAPLPLTAAESAALEAIRAFVRAQHFPPTVRELAAVLGARSPGSVHRLLTQLERKHAITREPGRARACVPRRRRTSHSH